MKRRCIKCGTDWELKSPVSFREECPECAAFIHTCTYCRHYDAPNRGCCLPTTEPVRDQSEMNFCEEFEYGPGSGETLSKDVAAGRAAAQAAKAPQKAPTPDEARRRFEDLFRDPKK
ncbi:MAG: hypothetical protein NT049_14315 [Planctomycetota bacterium]|nr:hypothetical protein [Planctomycetota bacterium]